MVKKSNTGNFYGERELGPKPTFGNAALNRQYQNVGYGVAAICRRQILFC
jgi:hypothetical protein